MLLVVGVRMVLFNGASFNTSQETESIRGFGIFYGFVFKILLCSLVVVCWPIQHFTVCPWHRHQLTGAQPGIRVFTCQPWWTLDSHFGIFWRYVAATVGFSMWRFYFEVLAWAVVTGLTGRAAAVAGIFAPPRLENNPCIAEFCRLLHPWCQYIGDWSREEFSISRAEVELCITPGPETSLDEDKLLNWYKQ